MAAYQLYDTGLTVTQEDELFFYLFASIPVGFLFWDECPEGGNHFQSWNLWIRMKEEKRWKMQDWIRMSLIFETD